MLTGEQIKILQNYCAANGIVYYDLEQEIVDHLAAVIEAEQAQHSDKPFEKILEEQAPGFSKDWKMIESEKRKALRHEYFREFSIAFKSYFTVPKIAITIIAILLAFFALRKINRQVMNSLMLLVNIFNVFSLTYFKKQKELYKEMKATKICNLLIWKINKQIRLCFVIPVAVYFLSIIAFAINDTYFAFIKEFIYCYPLFVVVLFSIESTTYKMLQKIHSNYPLAFQS